MQSTAGRAREMQDYESLQMGVEFDRRRSIDPVRLLGRHMGCLRSELVAVSAKHYRRLVFPRLFGSGVAHNGQCNSRLRIGHSHASGEAGAIER
jgi:hypothetical protein